MSESLTAQVRQLKAELARTREELRLVRWEHGLERRDFYRILMEQPPVGPRHQVEQMYCPGCQRVVDKLKGMG